MKRGHVVAHCELQVRILRRTKVFAKGMCSKPSQAAGLRDQHFYIVGRCKIWVHVGARIRLVISEAIRNRNGTQCHTARDSADQVGTSLLHGNEDDI
jgi:hypothetical protein